MSLCNHLTSIECEPYFHYGCSAIKWDLHHQHCNACSKYNELSLCNSDEYTTNTFLSIGLKLICNLFLIKLPQFRRHINFTVFICSRFNKRNGGIDSLNKFFKKKASEIIV